MPLCIEQDILEWEDVEDAQDKGNGAMKSELADQKVAVAPDLDDEEEWEDI